MNETTFNPDEFLAQTTTEQMDTRFPSIPPGEYPAIIDGIAVRQQPGKDDPTKLFTLLDVTYAIDDAGVKAATGLVKPTIRQTVFLDLNDAGQLDTGKSKNVNLGRLREALGLNVAGQAFSFQNLVGQACVVKTKLSPNKNDPENPYSNVEKVGKLV